MKSGQATINLLRIELQHKSPTIVYKNHKPLQQKNPYVCKQCKNGQSTINLLQTELQQNSLTIF
jgi:hypothetical protein